MNIPVPGCMVIVLKGNDMATISELKEKIIELKMNLIRVSIPKGHCPYAYYNSSLRDEINCNEIECDECIGLFMKNMEKEIRKEVRKL